MLFRSHRHALPTGGPEFTQRRRTVHHAGDPTVPSGSLYARAVELSGNWKARIADDDVRREGVGLDQDDTDWTDLVVPGHWRDHPEFADSDGPVLMRRTFHLDPPPDGIRRFVTLEGVFYQADVWLDGAYLGDPEGYFFPSTFDITDLSRLATDHVLAVEVACSPQRQRNSKRNITGTLQHSDMLDPSWNPGGLWRPVTLIDTGPIAPMLQAGKVRALAVTSDQRLANYPNVPTLKEQGVDLSVNLWSGLLAPAGTPTPIIARVQAEVARIMAMPDVIDRMSKLDIRPVGGTPAEMAKTIASEIELWSGVARANQITAQ